MLKEANGKLLLLVIALLGGFSPQAFAQYPEWMHSGSFYLLTTPEGASLPATAAEENFPLLVRLDKDWFDFSQTKANGEDVRFSAGGKPLTYQVEDWDAAKGSASIWVRIPLIKGNARQEIKLHWGQAEALSESRGAAVFNEANGFLTVMHLSDPVNPVKDEVGTLTPTNLGAIFSIGMIGKSLNFVYGRGGVIGGENITNYPTGNSPSSTGFWFRDNQIPGPWGSRFVTWGIEGSGSKLLIGALSPLHLDNGFGMSCSGSVALGRWYHVAHTHSPDGGQKMYVNGQFNTSASAIMDFKNPTRMYIGGWYRNWESDCDVDEVRISRVARSADWIKLEYENQNPGQSLVGPLTQSGTDFSVSKKSITVLEGMRTTVTAKAGGAQKLYWIIKSGALETIVGVDRFNFTIEASRVAGDQAFVLQLKAVFTNDVKTLEIPVTIREDIPEPVFTLKAPAKWNGRETIEVVPQISNLKAMQAKGAGHLNYKWTVADGAVIKEIASDRLILKRSQYSGKLTVQLAIDNGGAEVMSSTTIVVTEPQTEVWARRIPAFDEKPAPNQFYARDDSNEGTLYYNGSLTAAVDSVFLRVYADGRLCSHKTRRLNPDKTYAFSAKLKPGFIHYTVEFGSQTGTNLSVLDTVTNLVCGDAYLVNGQSNAVADNPEDSYSNEWIRSFGNLTGGTNSGWGNAVRASNCGDAYRIGYWPMTLARSLMLGNNIPICIINGAVGGTRVDQHQANPTNHFDTSATFSIYGNLLTRVAAARLTHGIRGVLWHQGENNSGLASPTGDYDWKSYQQYFVDMAAAWKQDYPNIQHYYVYQVWPNPCSMGGDSSSSSDMLREKQRTLPRLFSNLSVMSTLGVSGFRGLCHFDSTGYEQIADLMCPLVERDNYGLVSAASVTAPDIQRAWFTSASRTEIAMEFNQEMVWNSRAPVNFYLDRVGGLVTSGSADGKVVKLQLARESTSQTIGYIVDQYWDGTSTNLLSGSNGVAALTFFNVTIEK